MTFQIQDFGKLANLVAWTVFAQGIANLLWMPIALCYGKRLVMIVTVLIFLVGTIWSSTAKSFNSLLGSRILASIGSGSVESLGPNIIAGEIFDSILFEEAKFTSLDLFFERNFAAAMAVYTFSLSAGSQFGPLIGGYLIAARGWRWFFYLLIILIAVNLLFIVFTLPETTYKRIYQVDETAADHEEKSKAMHVEAQESSGIHDTRPAFGRPFYFKNVLFIRHRSVEDGGITKLLYIAALPFGFLLVPAALFTTILYGIVLGW
jgi:MFS family permease